jgi:hypothetical protein
MATPGFQSCPVFKNQFFAFFLVGTEIITNEIHKSLIFLKIYEIIMMSIKAGEKIPRPLHLLSKATIIFE